MTGTVYGWWLGVSTYWCCLRREWGLLIQSTTINNNPSNPHSHPFPTWNAPESLWCRWWCCSAEPFGWLSWHSWQLRPTKSWSRGPRDPVKIIGKLLFDLFWAYIFRLFLLEPLIMEPLKMMRRNSGESWNVMNCYVRQALEPVPTADEYTLAESLKVLKEQLGVHSKRSWSLQGTLHDNAPRCSINYNRCRVINKHYLIAV